MIKNTVLNILFQDFNSETDRKLLLLFTQNIPETFMNHHHE